MYVKLAYNLIVFEIVVQSMENMYDFKKLNLTIVVFFLNYIIVFILYHKRNCLLLFFTESSIQMKSFLQYVFKQAH